MGEKSVIWKKFESRWVGQENEVNWDMCKKKKKATFSVNL